MGDSLEYDQEDADIDEHDPQDPHTPPEQQHHSRSYASAGGGITGSFFSSSYGHVGGGPGGGGGGGGGSGSPTRQGLASPLYAGREDVGVLLLDYSSTYSSLLLPSFYNMDVLLCVYVCRSSWFGTSTTQWQSKLPRARARSRTTRITIRIRLPRKLQSVL